MKKIFMLPCIFICIFFAAGCCNKLTGEDDLIKKAREEIPVADADTIDLIIAGSNAIENDYLFWFISGNEYQSHTYTPIEFAASGTDQYKYVKTYKPMERGQDISVLMWKEGHSFVINNTNCCSIIIKDPFGETNTITVDEVPFVYYHNGDISEYNFIDKDGNTI